jgi:hypothetical protein
MIYDGIKPDYGEVIKSAESTVPIKCRHEESFMEQAAKMDYGDVILCHRCNLYFTKIKTMPRIIREHTIFHDSPSGKIKVTMKPAQQHWERICLVRVPVRILDDKQEKES